MGNFNIINMLFPPQIRNGRTLADKLLEGIAFLLFLALWGMTLYLYQVLPEQIPINFDAQGHINRYGSKSILFVVSGMYTLISLILGICAYHPRTINVPVAMRTPFQHILACRMTRTCNLILPFLCAGILLGMAAPDLGISQMLTPIIALSAVLLLLIVVVFYSILITRAGRNT